jgi:hypothetical protein
LFMTPHLICGQMRQNTSNSTKLPASILCR